MPISALMIDETVYQPIAEESGRIGTLGHGFTAGGHPVAAAVALENLAIIEERDLVGNARVVGAHMRRRLADLAGHRLVGEVRGVGMIAAVELVVDKAAKKALDPVGKLGGMVVGVLQEKGVIGRAMGDALAFCPPMIITETQVDDMVARLADSLDVVAAQLGL
jgi:4-aminobutyrate--pyruvate transaminase